MGKVSRVLRCYNCGAVLQTKKKTEKGYIPDEVMDEYQGDGRVLYCQKCFDYMKGLNTGALEQNVDKATAKILDDAVATDAYIVWVLDLFTFNGTLNPDIISRIKKLKVAVIGTHRDLFSSLVKDETFERFLKERFGEVGVEPDSIKIIGNEDDADVQGIMEDINKARRAHDVYIIGSKSSGKTSLINRLLKYYVNKTRWPIKTENYRGTNVKVMSIPLSNSSFAYELPGFSLATSVVGKVEKDIQKLIVPKRRIETHYRTITKGDAIAVGSLAYFSMTVGKPTAIKLYCAEGVEIKKLSADKVDEFLEENNRKRLLRPVSERINNFRDYDLFEYQMESDGQVHDISIEGLCWISFVAKGQVIRVMFPKGSALKESLGKLR